MLSEAAALAVSVPHPYLTNKVLRRAPKDRDREVVQSHTHT